MSTCKSACPACGSHTGIYSYYRDGGSTLSHPSCKVNPVITWPNPEFVPLNERFKRDT